MYSVTLYIVLSSQLRMDYIIISCVITVQLHVSNAGAVWGSVYLVQLNVTACCERQSGAEKINK